MASGLDQSRQALLLRQRFACSLAWSAYRLFSCADVLAVAASAVSPAELPECYMLPLVSLSLFLPRLLLTLQW